jgi:formylmethanofuran dehydrogenase subunit E
MGSLFRCDQELGVSQWKAYPLMSKEKKMEVKDYFEMALKFHGHKCPAMPMGLRAGIAAMKALRVDRAINKELHVIAETGDTHAAGCFVDGIMAATGCTYGKSNIEKKHYNKMAFTLIDVKKQKAVRVSLKPEFFANALKSPFVRKRAAGIEPQDIEPAITDPLVEKVLSIPNEQFLVIGEVIAYPMKRAKGVYEAVPCAVCGELVFVDKAVEKDGMKLCIPCSEKK